MKRSEKRLRERLEREKKRALKARREAYRRGYSKGNMVTIPVERFAIEERKTAKVSGSVTYDRMEFACLSGKALAFWENEAKKMAAAALIEKMQEKGLISYMTTDSANPLLPNEARCIASLEIVLPPKKWRYAIKEETA